jgi:Mg2+-importing ATPase
MKYVLMGTSSNFGNMVSMAGAIVFLPFLPMRPTQILLNNFLYDLAEAAIPTDRVDASYVVKPQRWDAGLIRRFMLVIGPLSSIYDFVTFAALLFLFQAGEALFQTGWFVESLATQTLVVFVIRTAGAPWRSRPSPALALTTLAIVAVALAVPFTPAAGPLGFVPLPPAFFVFLAAVTLTYLALVEVVKRRLLRPEGAGRA